MASIVDVPNQCLAS